MELNEGDYDRNLPSCCECDFSQSDSGSLWSVNDESPHIYSTVSNELSDEPSSPVSLAAREGKLEDLCSLIQSGSPVDVTDVRGWNALHEAAAHPTDVKCLQEILKHDSCDVNLITYQYETALLVACKKKCGEVAEMAVDLLLFYGADANIADGNGVTPLFRATSNGELNVITRLLDSGCADPELGNIMGCRPIHKAAKAGNLEILKCLLHANARIDVQKDGQQTPLHVAAKHGHPECLNELLQVAAERGQKEIIDSGSKLGTPLMVAARRGHAECVQLLLDHGANPNLDTGELPCHDGSATALHMAVRGNHGTCLELLLDKMDLQPLINPKVPISQNYISPVLLAFKYDHSECLGMLLSAGFDADSTFHRLCQCCNDLNDATLVPFWNMQTTLSIAACVGRTKCMKVLLDKNASVNPVYCKNSDNEPLRISFPPVISALTSKTWEPLDLLIKYGCDISYHRSAIHSNECLLFSFCNYEWTKKLLMCGSDPHLCFQKKYVTSLKHFVHHVSGRYTESSFDIQWTKEGEDRTLNILELLLEFTAITEPVKYFFHEVSRDYEKNFGPGYNAERWNAILQETDEPSSLANLCRIKFRQFLISLHGYSDFIRAINHLDLPVMLNRYLQYKDWCK